MGSYLLGKKRKRVNDKIKPCLVNVYLLNPGVFLEKGYSAKGKFTKKSLQCIRQLEFFSLTEHSLQCLGLHIALQIV